MQTTPTSRLLALAVTGAITLVACGGSDSGSSDADPCDVAKTVSEAFDVGQASESPEEGLAAAADFAAALEDFAKVVPDDLKDDVLLLADGMSKLADSDPEVGPSEETLAIIDGDDYDAASEKLEDYARETCDIEFE